MEQLPINYYYHVIEDSQCFTDINHIINYLEYKNKLNEFDVKYLKIALENTIKNGYKLIKENE